MGESTARRVTTKDVSQALLEAEITAVVEAFHTASTYGDLWIREPDLQSLREDPRYQELVERLSARDGA